MNLPQYPGGYDPYPGAWQPAPSGGTAIAAGVLAALGAVSELFGGLVDVALGATGFGREYVDSGVYSRSWAGSYLMAIGVSGFVIGALLAWGAIAIFLRKPIGRSLIVVATVLSLLIGFVGVAVSASAGAFDSAAGAVGGTVGGLVGLAFPVVTLILALVPATGRWLAHRPTGAYPPGYPGAPYSPQSYPSQPYPGQPPSPQPQAPQPGPVPTDNPWGRPES